MPHTRSESTCPVGLCRERTLVPFGLTRTAVRQRETATGQYTPTAHLSVVHGCLDRYGEIWRHRDLTKAAVARVVSKCTVDNGCRGRRASSGVCVSSHRLRVPCAGIDARIARLCGQARKQSEERASV